MADANFFRHKQAGWRGGHRRNPETKKTAHQVRGGMSKGEVLVPQRFPKGRRTRQIGTDEPFACALECHLNARECWRGGGFCLGV